MTAVFAQQVAHPVQRIHRAEFRDAAHRASALLLPQLDHDGGSVVFLHQPVRYQAHDAGGVIGRGDKEQAAVVNLLEGVLARDGERLLGHGLALAVLLFEFGSERLGLGRFGRHQQVIADHGMFEPASGVEARPDDIAQGIYPNMARLDAGQLEQGAQAEAARLVHHGQPLPNQVAVFLGQGGHVGHRTKGDQVEQVVGVKVTLAFAEGGSLFDHKQGLGQLVGQADTGQSLGGIGAAGLARAEDSVGGGQRLGRFVVVGDDDVEAELAAVNRLHLGSDATVDGDDHLEAILGQLFQRVLVDAVALFKAVRDIWLDRSA